MQTQTHPLIAPTLGTARNLMSFHYGPGGGQKIYIQSSLHADELPGMLVSWALRRKLAALEAAGKLRGEVVIVPVANPIGLNQHFLGHLSGRFETNTAQNFNRNFHDLSALVQPRHRGAPDRQRRREPHADPHGHARGARRANAGTPNSNRSASRCKSSRTTPTSCSICIATGKPRCTSTRTRICGRKSSRSRATSTPRRRCSRSIRWAIRSTKSTASAGRICAAAYGDRFPIPNGSISVTIELRGQREVSYEYAEHDAQAIIEYLTSRGVIDGTAAPLPPLEFAATPLAGAEPIVAPMSGVLVYRCEVGTWVDVGPCDRRYRRSADGQRRHAEEQRGRRAVRAAFDALCDGRSRVRAHCRREGVPQRFAVEQLKRNLDGAALSRIAPVKA